MPHSGHAPETGSFSGDVGFAGDAILNAPMSVASPP